MAGPPIRPGEHHPLGGLSEELGLATLAPAGSERDLVDLALMVEPQLGGTYDEILAVARWAERHGLVAFARSDHYGWTDGDPRPATDAFATLAGLARDTATIRLTVLVSPLTFRHPAVIAKNAATIDQMSNGRFDLGIGTGWMGSEHRRYGIPFPEPAERFERFEDSLGYLRAAFDGRPHAGTFFSLSTEAWPGRTGPLPIVIGGSGPRRTPRVAGTYADEYNMVIDEPHEMRDRIARMRRAAEHAGRDPESITISVMSQVFSGRDEDEYRQNLEDAAAFWHEDVDEFEHRARNRGLPMGMRPAVEARLDELADLGVDKLYLQFLDRLDAGRIDRAYGGLFD